MRKDITLLLLSLMILPANAQVSSLRSPRYDGIILDKPNAFALPYNRGGVGAVTRDLLAKLSDMRLDVRDFGAICDNNTANASVNNTAFTNAMNALKATGQGGEIGIPKGTCVISQAITVPARLAVLFAGESQGASVIRQTSTTADGIVFANDDYLTQGAGARNLTVESGAGLVSALSFAPGSSGRGIVFVHANDNSGLRDVSINNFATGMALLGSFNSLHTNVRIMFTVADGILIDKAADGTVGAGNRISQAKMSNLGMQASTAASHGIRIRASGGEYLNTIDATTYGTAYLLDPRAGDQVAYIFGHTLLADTSLGDGFVLDATAGNITRIQCTACWAGYNGNPYYWDGSTTYRPLATAATGGNGIVTKGSNLKGARFVGTTSRENGLRAWLHQGGVGVEFTAPEFHQNGQITSGTYPGVEIAAGVTNFGILGGSIGNRESGLPATQAESIKFAGAAAGFRIEGVDMAAPGTGKSVVSYADESLITSFKMLGNLPVNSYGVNPSERITVPFGGFIAANTTSYFEANGPTTAVMSVPFFTAKPATVGKVYVAVPSAPGVGQTFTYRLVVNGTPVGSTAVISGNASFQATLFPGITLAANDTFEIQIITSTGATATAHRGYIMLEP